MAKASISGVVFGDSDKSKDFNSPDSIGPKRIVKLLPLNKVTTADDDGNFSFENLDAGDYQITRDYPKGFKMANPTVAGGSVIDVKLAAGEKKIVNVGSAYINESEYNTMKCTISGTVFGDSDNNKVFNEGDSEGAKRTVRLNPGNIEIRSNNRSQYKFENLEPGTYQLTRDFPKGFKMANPTKSGTNIIEVTVVAGENKIVDIGSTYDKSEDSDPQPPLPPDDNPPVEPPLPPVPPTPTGSHLVAGMCGATVIDPTFMVTTKDGSQKRWVDLVRSWNIKEVREWHSCTYRTSKRDKSAFNGARKWANLGFVPTICLATEAWEGVSMPTPQQSRDCAKQIVDCLDGLKAKMEVGNEPNLAGYWPFKDAKKFVDNVGNPMYEVFHAAGLEVIGASVTYDVPYVKKMLDAGLKCDAIGFHPYRLNARDLDKLMASLVEVTKDLPVDLTEWNAFLGPQYRSFADPKNTHGVADKYFKTPAMNADQILKSQKEQLEVLKKYKQVRTIHYFISISTNWKHTTGPLALLDEKIEDKKIVSAKTTRFADEFWGQAF